MQKIFLYLLGPLMKKNQRHKNPCQRGTNYFSKNSVQLGQNFQNGTSRQVVGNIKLPLLTNLDRSKKTLLRNLQRSCAVTSTQNV